MSPGLLAVRPVPTNHLIGLILAAFRAHRLGSCTNQKFGVFMYVIVIAWMYVVLMMSVAEATATQGTLLGAIVTFFLYGVGPAALVAYLMGTPARKRGIKKREAEALAKHQASKLIDEEKV